MYSGRYSKGKLHIFTRNIIALFDYNCVPWKYTKGAVSLCNDTLLLNKKIVFVLKDFVEVTVSCKQNLWYS